MQVLHTLNGVVIKGKNRGKDLGFPTINIPLDQKIPEGIYISQIRIGDKLYDALTFIGTAKTFGESILQAETYVLDFDEQVYGDEVEISLLKKIRDNQKFENAEELIKQMEKDKEQALDFFLYSDNGE